MLLETRSVRHYGLCGIGLPKASVFEVKVLVISRPQIEFLFIICITAAR